MYGVIQEGTCEITERDSGRDGYNTNHLYTSFFVSILAII